MIIGITGQIGSGKSSASTIMNKHGWVVVDADQISRKVVKNNKKLLNELKTSFGTDVITSNGNLARKKLAEKAFANKSSQLKLNKITHPYILDEIKSQIYKYKKENRNIVLDAPLLLDKAKYKRLVKKVIMIHASEQLRIERLVKKGFTKSDILVRQKRQLSYIDYRARSDYMILNNGSLKALERKLMKLVNKLV